MNYAFINGKILNGTKDMTVKEGFTIFTQNDKQRADDALYLAKQYKGDLKML